MELISVKLGDLVASGEAIIKTGPFGTQLKAAEYVDYGTPVCLSIRNCIKRAPKSTVPSQHRFGFEKPCFCSL